MTKLMMKIFR